MVIYYVIGAAVFVLLFGAGFLVRSKTDKFALILKIVSASLYVLFLLRYLSGEENVSQVRTLQVGYGFSGAVQTVFAFLQMWTCYAAVLLVVLYPFFNGKVHKTLTVTFGTAVFFLNFVFLKNHILAVEGPAGVEGVTFRGVLMAVETGVGLAYCVGALLSDSSVFRLKKKEVVVLCFALLGILFATMPTYTFRFFGNETALPVSPKKLNLYHRLYIYPIAVMPIALYFILRNFEKDTRRLVLLYYSLGVLLGFLYANKFADFAGNRWVTSLPLHLCNTALFITPLCLAFNWKKLFYFTYFINVLGAFLAITMPNFGNGTYVMSYSAVQFFRDHYQAFAMPLLTVGLGIFPRPRWKEFRYSLVGFTVYLFLMIIINAWFTNYNADVDYFFINSDFIAEKLGTWAENLRKVVTVFKIGDLTITLYPVYQLLFYLVYVAASFGMWFLYELAYDVVAGWQDIARRQKKIKVDALALKSALNGRSIEEPVNMENVNKLVLKNFTKRYGASDVYAVKDASLEVVGGEIFGFLGPNGAGKSTIIKSIVGIQTITDGSIEVCGYDVAMQPVEAKRQIGFVPDHYALYERLTAREYINYIADLYGVPQKERDERLAYYVKLFEFENAVDNRIRTYSHGMKQKVTIMAALIHEPKVWILDEPLTGLDPTSIFQVKECMKQHAAKGNIVFFSSHIIDVVERICDRIAIIQHGQIQCVRDVPQIELTGTLEKFYLDTIKNDVQAVAVGAPEQSNV